MRIKLPISAKAENSSGSDSGRILVGTEIELQQD